jgi:hypothetical protein
VNQQALKKRLFLTAIIYIFSAGIVLANCGCLLAGFKHCESQNVHHGSTSSGHDPPHDCSPTSKSSLCHQLLNFNVAVQDIVLSTELPEKSPTSFNLAAAVASVLAPGRSNHYFACLKTLQIKIPSIPLYLSNLSLLF